MLRLLGMVKQAISIYYLRGVLWLSSRGVDFDARLQTWPSNVFRRIVKHRTQYKRISNEKGVYNPGAHIVHASVFTIQNLRWLTSFDVQIQLPDSPGPDPDPVAVALMAGEEE